VEEENQAWWYTPVIPKLRRLRQEDSEFKASLGYIRSLKKKKKRNRRRRRMQSRTVGAE
jgi:hypothetical protein